MKISIVIPTLNEERNIVPIIAYLKNNSNPENIREIIVSDGGSCDDTVQLAIEAGAIVVSGNKGRACQLNTGARFASGEIVYFLHADSFPPINFDFEIISKVINKSEAGCFIMKFNNTHPFMKFWGWLTKFTGPYFRGGDQSLFVTKSLFLQLHGYNSNLKIMEDYDIVHRLKTKTNFKVIKKWLTTSARKYEKVGIYKLQIKFAAIYLMYCFGFSQESLENFYMQHIEN